MAAKSKGSRKPAEASHSAGTWSVRLNNGYTEHIAEAFMRRNGDDSYTFTRDGQIVFDAPPGQVSFARRHSALPAGTRPLLLPESLVWLSPSAIRDLQDAIRDQGVCPGAVVLSYGSEVRQSDLAADGPVAADGAEPETGKAGTAAKDSDPGPIETGRAK